MQELAARQSGCFGHFLECLGLIEKPSVNLPRPNRYAIHKEICPGRVQITHHIYTTIIFRVSPLEGYNDFCRCFLRKCLNIDCTAVIEDYDIFIIRSHRIFQKTGGCSIVIGAFYFVSVDCIIRHFQCGGGVVVVVGLMVKIAWAKHVIAVVDDAVILCMSGTRMHQQPYTNYGQGDAQGPERREWTLRVHGHGVGAFHGVGAAAKRQAVSARI